MSEYVLEKGRPADASGRLGKEIRVYDFLDRLGIDYERVDHPALMTMEACESVDKMLDTRICKNLFLRNAQRTQFYLLLMPGDKNSKPPCSASRLVRRVSPSPNRSSCWICWISRPAASACWG